MNAGYGVGDVIAVSNLAWSVYKSCKDAPQEFKKISRDVSSLHVVLKETGEMITELAQNEGLDPRKVKQLRHLTLGCHDVLTELRKLLSRFNRLKSSSRFTLDRLLWSPGDVKDLRDRIVWNFTVLGQLCHTIQMCVFSVYDGKLLIYKTGHLQPR
jgi:hypothetical protein